MFVRVPCCRSRISLRGDEERFVAGHARPLYVLAQEKTALVIEVRFARVNLFATAIDLPLASVLTVLF